MTPPLFARVLLSAVAGPEQAECVAGDLSEEFPLICQRRGRAAGARWYTWQVIRSIAPLLDLRIRSGEFTGMVIAAGLGVALPLILLDRLWTLIASHVPLKDGLERSPIFLGINVLVACALAAAGGARVTSRRSATWGAVIVAIAAVLALEFSVAQVSNVYPLTLLIAAPASSIAGFRLRRISR